jgi:hypothetical protein
VLRKTVSRLLLLAMSAVLLAAVGGNAQTVPMGKQPESRKAYIKHQKHQQKKWQHDQKKAQKKIKEEHPS